MSETVTAVSAQVAVATPANRPPPATGKEGFQPFGSDGLTFLDVLDVVNPLQHIPVISAIYRHLTGDEIDPVPRVAGGTLFGGLIGAAVSVFNVILKEFTGRDTGEHVLALLTGEDEPIPETVAETAAESAAHIAWNGPRVAPMETPETAVEIAWNGPRVVPGQALQKAAIDEIPGGSAELAQRPPHGAVALEGGWFSATMLTALSHYEKGAQLTLPRAPARVDLVQ